METLGSVFILAPYLALLPALLFVWLYRRSKSKTALFSAFAWVLYGIYEAGMYLRLLCSGECNIRIDLLLIYPFLFLLSIIALALSVYWQAKSEE